MIGTRVFPVCSVFLFAVAAAPAAAPSGVYSGSYTCAQEATPLQLTVNTVRPNGAFTATAAFEKASAGRTLEFHHGQFSRGERRLDVALVGTELQVIQSAAGELDFS
jgi:hypothetical protein